MIPKKIHYCWFGHGKLSDLALRCIESWRKFFPDYEIVRWDESNFDVDAIPYTSEAYAAGKYAFVSDYARFKILYEHGGLYFDTDVEVIKPMGDIVDAGPFMGCELPYKPGVAAANMCVAPGLGLGTVAGCELYKEVLDYYSQLHFANPDGSLNMTTVVLHVTKVLVEHGLINTPYIQEVDGIRIYPSDYFNPLDDATGKLNITPNTRSIHWFAKSWVNQSSLRTGVSRFAHRLLGVEGTAKIKKLLNLR